MVQRKRLGLSVESMTLKVLWERIKVDIGHDRVTGVLAGRRGGWRCKELGCSLSGRLLIDVDCMECDALGMSTFHRMLHLQSPL
jgi:hypothetical protein